MHIFFNLCGFQIYLIFLHPFEMKLVIDFISCFLNTICNKYFQSVESAASKRILRYRKSAGDKPLEKRIGGGRGQQQDPVGEGERLGQFECQHRGDPGESPRDE